MQDEANKREVLKTSSQYVKGVGPARQKILKKLGIETVEDLLLHFPRKYYDRSDMAKVSELNPGEEATFTATVLATSMRRLRGRSTLLKVAVGDETGRADLVFFNQPFLEKRFKQGRRAILSGQVSLYKGEKQLNSPDFEFLSDDSRTDLIHTGRIVPVYPLTAGISQRMMRSIIRAALVKCRGSIMENLPVRIMGEMAFMKREESLLQIHFPDSFEKLDAAVKRFKFEEVFFIHLLLKSRRRWLLEKKNRPGINPPYALMNRFLDSLPFRLTGAQDRVLKEILGDIESERGLARLLQGDVGSGKTVVGLASMMAAVGNGYQAALMVPTEILAEQHFNKVEQYLGGMGVRAKLLVGSLKRAEKEKVYKELRDGSIDIVVGTQALIQEGISFKQLGLAVIDEQHRFGVKQRAKLGKSGFLPHFLVMTATPIPRSLAQIIYGDLSLSVIDELPFGSRTVKTEILHENERDTCYSEAKKIFDREGRAFILYPLVEESEKSDMMSATGEFERLQREVFVDYPLGILHGRMSYEEKSRALTMFRKGEISALVTTTVIEVGVDVPEAELLIINNPERFGLAQLHQLRGRIGRSGGEGRCFLIINDDISSSSLRRLHYFTSTNDGFKVAEKDLEIRGPGEIWGTRQSGSPVFRLLNPISDNEIVQSSWMESERLIKSDPSLERKENRVVADYFRMYYEPRIEIAEIG